MIKPITDTLAPRPGLAAGTVIAAHGRHLLVAVDGEAGVLRQAVTRGRRTDCCVGDRVDLTLIGSLQAAIDRLQARTNLMMRSDAGRSKPLAANLDRVAIVLSGDPPFSEELLMRVLAAAATEAVPAAIIAGKCDLHEAHARIAPRLALYESLGWPVFRISVRTAPEASLATLAPFLAGRRTLLLGQSGMGKSTLVNLLVPDADQATREISVALSSGRHTTSFCKLFGDSARLATGTTVIDSPGFQLFGIAHLSRSQLMHALPDFRPRLGQCRFANCLHRNEPGCAIDAAVQSGAIDARRHQLYQRMLGDALS